MTNTHISTQQNTALWRKPKQFNNDRMLIGAARRWINAVVQLVLGQVANYTQGKNLCALLYIYGYDIVHHANMLPGHKSHIIIIRDHSHLSDQMFMARLGIFLEDILVDGNGPPDEGLINYLYTQCHTLCTLILLFIMDVWKLHDHLNLSTVTRAHASRPRQ